MGAHWEWKDFCKDKFFNPSSSQFGEWGACKTGYGGGPFQGHVGPVKLQILLLEDLASPYATAIAGNFTSQQFDRSSGDYSLDFDIDPSIRAPTLVSTPALVYP